MSQFFAAKLRTAVLWKVYELSGDRTSAERAIELYENARNIWYDMAKRAENVYKKNIAYGFDSANGHWIDRVPSFDEDIEDLKNRLKNSPIEGTEVKKTVVDKAIDLSLSKPSRPTVEIEHSPITAFQRGKPLSIVLKASNNVERVLLYYRHVNQSEYWQYTELNQKGSSFDGEIPASFTDNRFPLQYYFEIYTDTSEATLHPILDEDLANVPYYVAHSNDPS